MPVSADPVPNQPAPVDWAKYGVTEAKEDSANPAQFGATPVSPKDLEALKAPAPKKPVDWAKYGVVEAEDQADPSKFGAVKFEQWPPANVPGMPGGRPPGVSSRALDIVASEANRKAGMVPNKGGPFQEFLPVDPAAAQELGEGFVELAAGPKPGTSKSPQEAARAASKVVRGGLGVLNSPAGMAAAGAPPAAALIKGVVLGSAAQRGTEYVLKESGVPEAYATLAGDVAGVVAGGSVIRRGLKAADAAIEAHNQSAARLLEQERLGGQQSQRFEDIFAGESHPIRIGNRDARLEYEATGATEAGRPISAWRVVAEDGAVLHRDITTGMKTWLQNQGAVARSTGEAPPAPPAEPPPVTAEQTAGAKTSEQPPLETTEGRLEIEDLAQRLRDIRGMEEHFASGQDVQLGSKTMEQTTSEQRREMLRQNIEQHRAIYEREWAQLTKEIGAEEAAKLRSKMENAASPPAAPPPILDIQAGATFETPTGTIRVQRVTKNGKVLFQQQTASGKISGAVPLQAFRDLLASPPAAEPASAPDAAATASPAIPADFQQEPATPALPAAAETPAVVAPSAAPTGWIQQSIDQQFELAQRLNIVEDIERLSAEQLTAGQIAGRLADKLSGDSLDRTGLIRAVRSKLRIPSMDEREDFAAWLKQHQAKKRRPPATRYSAVPGDSHYRLRRRHAALGDACYRPRRCFTVGRPEPRTRRGAPGGPENPRTCRPRRF